MPAHLLTVVFSTSGLMPYFKCSICWASIECKQAPEVLVWLRRDWVTGCIEKLVPQIEYLLTIPKHWVFILPLKYVD